MAEYDVLGIKYNADKKVSTLNEIAYRALTEEYIEPIRPGSDRNWKTIIIKKVFYTLLDIVLDTLQKYGHKIVLKLITKTNLNKKTQKFLLSIIDYFLLLVPQHKDRGYTFIKELVMNYVSQHLDEFLDADESREYATMQVSNISETVIEDKIYESVEMKYNEILKQWHVERNVSTASVFTDTDDIKETTIPDEILIKLQKDDLTQQSTIPESQQIKSSENKEDNETNKAMWIITSIGIAGFIAFIVYIIYKINKRGGRRR